MKSFNKSDQVLWALAFIGVGVMFLMGMGILWPLFILMPGMAMLALTFSNGKVTAPFAIPGMIVAGTGALLFVTNLTGYWASWSYAWTLYGVFLGMGMGIMGRLMESESLQAVGRGFVKTSLIAFAGFAFLMEVMFNVGGSAALFPFLLIGIGIYLLMKNSGEKAKLPAKSKRKAKNGDVLFTGPVVYGSTYGSRLVEQEKAESSRQQ